MLLKLHGTRLRMALVRILLGVPVCFGHHRYGLPKFNFKGSSSNVGWTTSKNTNRSKIIATMKSNEIQNERSSLHAVMREPPRGKCSNTRWNFGWMRDHFLIFTSVR